MICPKCREAMEKVTHEGIEVDRCTGCGGIWFDQLEKERLAELEGSDRIDTGDPETGKRFDEVDRIACPLCGIKMIRMVDTLQPHIRFESCKGCYGVFLDAGEFSDLQDRTLLDRLKDLFTAERD